ncbi:MAG: hypothetical protein FJX76_09885 [Armatimonadetes bacterium]|nr:hypothetical protein [Armatimonadota bacterium]
MTGMDKAFEEALQRQEALQKKHREDLAQLECMAEEGKQAGRKVTWLAAGLGCAVLAVVAWIALSDPSTRGIFGFFFMLLAFGAVWRYWKAKG